MLFTGLPEHGWEDSYYTSLEEIPSPEKALGGGRLGSKRPTISPFA